MTNKTALQTANSKSLVDQLEASKAKATRAQEQNIALQLKLDNLEQSNAMAKREMAALADANSQLRAQLKMLGEQTALDLERDAKRIRDLENKLSKLTVSATRSARVLRSTEAHCMHGEDVRSQHFEMMQIDSCLSKMRRNPQLLPAQTLDFLSCFERNAFRTNWEEQGPRAVRVKHERPRPPVGIVRTGTLSKCPTGRTLSRSRGWKKRMFKLRVFDNFRVALSWFDEKGLKNRFDLTKSCKVKNTNVRKHSFAITFILPGEVTVLNVDADSASERKSWVQTLLEAIKWAPDKPIKKPSDQYCKECNVEFSLTKWRYSCEVSGWCVCYYCSVAVGKDDNVRKCKNLGGSNAAKASSSPSVPASPYAVDQDPRALDKDAVFGAGKAEAVDPDVIGEETEL